MVGHAAPPSWRPSLSCAASSPPQARIMHRRTHHASPRRLPSRNGRPTRASPPSMGPHFTADGMEWHR
jgi:hypothetical protein